MTRGRRNTIVAASAVVAAIAAWASYWHGVEVCVRAGEQTGSAHLIPVLPDAAMVIGGLVIAMPGVTRRRMVWSRTALFVGIGFSIWFNIAAAGPHLVSKVVAAMPAVFLLITAELLMTLVLRTRPARKRAPAKSKATKAQPVRARRLAVA